MRGAQVLGLGRAWGVRSDQLAGQDRDATPGFAASGCFDQGELWHSPSPESVETVVRLFHRSHIFELNVKSYRRRAGRGRPAVC